MNDLRSRGGYGSELRKCGRYCEDKLDQKPRESGASRRGLMKIFHFALASRGHTATDKLAVVDALSERPRAAPAALALALHRRATLAGGDAVAVAFEHALGAPADNRAGITFGVQLSSKFLLELFDERHVVCRISF